MSARRERWWFVRHAQSEANAGGWLSGHADARLTLEGRAQAAALQASLPDVLRRPSVRVVSSDLSRAFDTARLLVGPHRPIHVTPRLRERDMGRWTRGSIAALRDHGLDEVMYGWDARPPGGECLREVAGRAAAWLAELPPHPGGTLVVAHGGLLRVLLGLLDGADPRQPLPRRHMDNAMLVDRELPGDAWTRLVEVLRERA